MLGLNSGIYRQVPFFMLGDSFVYKQVGPKTKHYPFSLKENNKNIDNMLCQIERLASKNIFEPKWIFFKN